MDGKPASDWPLIIDAYNRSLLYDDDGNIISIIPFNAGAGDGYIVLRNGEYDAPYTAQLNQEQNSQFWQTLGDQAAQLLLGISEVIGGSVLWLGSSAVGAGGLALALPTGGTVTIPAAAVASAGYATSGTLIAGGTITVTDAISKIAAANANLQISFAKGYDEWKAVGEPKTNSDGKVTVKTNKGNEIDITPSDNHSAIKHKAPTQGAPNSSVDVLDSTTGEVNTRRYYDSNGDVYRDVDMTNHGNSKLHPEFPHEHHWFRDSNGILRRKK